MMRACSVSPLLLPSTVLTVGFEPTFSTVNRRLPLRGYSDLGTLICAYQVRSRTFSSLDRKKFEWYFLGARGVWGERKYPTNWPIEDGTRPYLRRP